MKVFALLAGVVVLGTVLGFAMPDSEPAAAEGAQASEPAVDRDDKFGAFQFEYRRTVQVSQADFSDALRRDVEHAEEMSDVFAEQVGGQMSFATDSDGSMNWVIRAPGRGRITLRTRVSAQGDGAVFTARVYAATDRGRRTNIDPGARADLRKSLDTLVSGVERNARYSLADGGDTAS